MPPPIVRKLALLLLNVFIDLLNSLTCLLHINGSHIPASLILLARSGFSGSWAICCIPHYPPLGTDVCFIFKSRVYVCRCVHVSMEVRGAGSLWSWSSCVCVCVCQCVHVPTEVRGIGSPWSWSLLAGVSCLMWRLNLGLLQEDQMLFSLAP